jgi:hypothetical protein
MNGVKDYVISFFFIYLFVAFVAMPEEGAKKLASVIKLYNAEMVKP